MGGGGSKKKPHMLLKETILDHEGAINCMAVSDDKSVVATGSDDKTVRLWSAMCDDTECLGVLRGHTGYVICVCMYDTYVISGSADTTIRKWDASSCDCVTVYRGHESRVLRVLCNGPYVFSGAKDALVKVWDFHAEYVDKTTCNASCKFDLTGHSHAISCLAFIHGDCGEDDILITGSADSTARSWNLESGETINIFRGHKGGVSCMAVNDDGTKLYTGSSDCNIKIWDIHTGEMLKTLKGHMGGIVCLDLANKLLFSGSQDDGAKCWVENVDVAGINYRGHLHTVTCVSYHEGYVFTGSSDACARVFDVKRGTLKAAYRAHNSAITCMILQGDYLYTGSTDATLRVWDASRATIESDELADLLDDEDEQELPKNKILEERKLREYERGDVDAASQPAGPRPQTPSLLGVPTSANSSRLAASPALHVRGRQSPSPSLPPSSPSPKLGDRLSPSPVPSPNMGDRLSPSQLSIGGFDAPRKPQTIEDLDL